MRWTRKKLLELADSEGVIKRGSVSIKIYNNGKIVRNDIRLDLARSMTVSEAVNCLKLDGK